MWTNKNPKSGEIDVSLLLQTRVLVTHSVTFLPEADVIVVLKDGQVTESGSYKQLVQNKGAFADFLLHYLEQADNLENEPGKTADCILVI